MNIFSALSLVALCIYFNIGFYSYRVYKNSKIRTLFLIFCICMSLWSFAYAFVYVSPINNGWWLKLSAVGWCTFSALVLHMVMKFTNSKIINNLVIVCVLYLPAVLFLFMDVFLFWPDKIPSTAVRDFFYMGDFIYNCMYLLISIILLYKWGKTVKSETKKSQSRILVLTSIAPFVFNLITQTLLPMIGVNSLPPIGQIYMLIMMFGIYWSSTQYGLFDIPYNLIFDEMLPEMMDMFFLLDPEGIITNINIRTENLLGYKKQELVNRSIEHLFVNGEKAYVLWDINNNDHNCTELELMKKNGEFIPVELSCSTVFSKNNKKILGRVIIGQDISIQKALEKEILIQIETEEKLRDSEERFRVIFTKHSAMMMLIEPDTLKIFLTNEASQRFYGYSEQQFGKLLITDLNGIKVPEINKMVTNIMANEENVLLMKHRLSSGELRYVEVHATPINFTKRKLIFSIIHDITVRKREEEHIIHLAYHDGLTDLYNHKYFYERLREETSRAERYNSKFAVMYIDMDRFKEINDNYGHDYGDLVLIEVSKRILHCIRESDIAARIGGDEFALILLDIQNVQEVGIVTNKLLEVFKKPLEIKEIELSIVASIGSSIYPDDGVNADYLISIADKAMYEMKNNRKVKGNNIKV